MQPLGAFANWQKRAINANIFVVTSQGNSEREKLGTALSVRSIMSSPVVTVELDDSVALVREIFANTNFHHVLAVEDGRLFGVVSDRDLLKALSPNLGTASEKASDTATLNKKVHQIMSRNPICLAQHESVHKAIELFEEHAISCIPIVDENRIPVGIVSWRDILKAIRRSSKD